MKIVFLGTPEFAVKPLAALLKSKHEVLAVISRPDRETDRKGNLLPTAVKSFVTERVGADGLGRPLSFYSFEKISRDGIDLIKKLKPDAAVTAAYGQILSAEFLNLFPKGVYNIHASLLPAYRGASPIQSAILNGDGATGVTIMKTEVGMDTGDIVCKSEVKITEQTTYFDLSQTLSALGADLIVSALGAVESGEAKLVKQDEKKATYCKKITKADGLLDFGLTAKQIVRKINAFNPWPTAYFNYNGQNIKVWSARGGDMPSDGALTIKCADGYVNILELQAPGKKRMNAADFLRGYNIDLRAVR